MTRSLCKPYWLVLFALLFLRTTALTAPVDVAQHGRRMTLGSGDNALTVLYLRGTPYEMGYAHGKLCAKEVRYLATMVAPLMLAGLHCSPEKADATWALYEKHLRPEYLEELRGLADGSGVSLKEIERLHAIPDISEWHCSFFAAIGKATASGALIQIRALDYTTIAGIQRYPALLVYQPVTGVPFVNVGWLGHCGMVTGMNSEGIAMSEIGDDWDKATDSFDGRPLTYVMRDSVQFGRNLEEALNLVKNGPRTTSLLYCLSSAREGQVRALQTSHTQCRIYTPATLPFARMPGLVYMSMGMDSAWNGKLGNALQQDYGRITPETAQQMMKQLGTGSLHAVVLQPATGDLWVANATLTEKAYNQPYHHFNLKQALADPFFRH
ncbi:MAG TPA: C45 family peptidase [Chthonomonadaceae bacterium]|nr:C45 family peptidase [Chthonomonadaceae bacterium]